MPVPIKGAKLVQAVGFEPTVSSEENPGLQPGTEPLSAALA